jgi:alkylated DNA repair dioxygenase AlkB
MIAWRKLLTEIKLRDGGVLLSEPAFLDRRAADVVFDWLRNNVCWGQEVGRGRPFPRLTAWYADAGLAYAYSEVTHRGAGWQPELLEIKQRVEQASAADFNSLLLNLYRDGRDSIGFHSDAEPELGINPVVASVSLGAVRRFILKHKKTGEKLSFRLAHGSLLVMGGTCQHHWLHGVPKTEEMVGERINLTFRKIFGDSVAKS